MIEITMRDVVNSLTTLQELLDKKLKSKTAFTLARIIREIETEYKTFQQSRTNLIQKYGARDEENNLITDENGNIHIAADKVEAFNTEIEELLDVKITLNANKIQLEDLDEVDFTPRQMVFLEQFVEG